LREVHCAIPRAFLRCFNINDLKACSFSYCSSEGRRSGFRVGFVFVSFPLSKAIPLFYPDEKAKILRSCLFVFFLMSVDGIDKMGTASEGVAALPVRFLGVVIRNVYNTSVELILRG
jgi:hypothetical protein